MSYQSEFSTTNKLARAVWGLVWSTVYRLTPRPCHGWRRFWLRRFGAEIAADAKIYASARIWAPWNLSMAPGSILGDRVDCYSVAPIVIGQNAVISQDAALCAATHDHKDDTFPLIPSPITIEQNAWVAARAFVGPGVTVGAAAVVGACAVVVKDVEPGTTMVGNPAKAL